MWPQAREQVDDNVNVATGAASQQVDVREMRLHALQGIKQTAGQMWSKQTAVWMWAQAQQGSGQTAGQMWPQVPHRSNQMAAWGG